MFKRIHILSSAALLASLLLLTPAALGQTTWYVDDNAPDDPRKGDPWISDPNEDGSAAHPFDAIQEGIDAAADGDTVLVLDGTYKGLGPGNRNLDLRSKAIVLRSQNGPAGCVINPQRRGSAFYIHRDETPACRVQGFTIRNGESSYGGGIYCSSSPIIENCVIVDNEAVQHGQFDGAGGGIFCCAAASPTIRDCVIANNSAYTGGGITTEYDDLIISNCIITGNSATLGGGIFCTWRSSVGISNSVIADNTAYCGGGIVCDTDDVLIRNCTITRNSTIENGNGGGLFCVVADPIIQNSVLWGNLAACGPEIDLLGGHPIISYSVVAGGIPDSAVDAGGNIDSDPMFTDPNAADFHLSPGSPCIDAGDPNAIPEPYQTDLDGHVRLWDGDGDMQARIDMGCYEYGALYPADLDNDGRVDASDLLLLLANYGSTGDATYTDGDLDFDSDVDLQDLAWLLGIYGMTYE
jgi:hypothetical protein